MMRTEDSPAAQLVAGDLDVKRPFGAKMYLLWKSSTAGAIQVPIGFVQWSFSSEAKSTTGNFGSWSLVAPTTGTASFTAAANGQAYDGYPTWSNLVLNGQCHSLYVTS